MRLLISLSVAMRTYPTQPSVHSQPNPWPVGSSADQLGSARPATKEPTCSKRRSSTSFNACSVFNKCFVLLILLEHSFFATEMSVPRFSAGTKFLIVTSRFNFFQVAEMTFWNLVSQAVNFTAVSALLWLLLACPTDVFVKTFACLCWHLYLLCLCSESYSVE